MLKPLRNIHTFFSKYIDVSYFLRFFFLLIFLYYFNLVYIAVIDPNGAIYFSFLDHYFNYINWIRDLILYPANLLCHFFGVNSFVDLPFHLRTVNGAYIEMVYQCLGLGLMSFWLAFVIADKTSLKRKLIWCISGVICIWFINIWRVSILLMAFEYHWKVNAHADHHTVFNIAAYILLIGLMSFYVKNAKKRVRYTELTKVAIE